MSVKRGDIEGWAAVVAVLGVLIAVVAVVWGCFLIHPVIGTLASGVSLFALGAGVHHLERNS